MPALFRQFGLQVRAFLAAVHFLTRIPVPRLGRDSDEAATAMRRGRIYFPLVGGLVGLSTAGIIVAASLLWNIWLAVAIGLTWEAWLTGAFHEDAVADFCDAFGGGWTREQVREILKDSRVGSFGALGLMLAVLLRASALTSLPTMDLLVAGAAAGALGRWLGLLVATLAPALPGHPGLARSLGTNLAGWEVVLGLLTALPAVVPLSLLEPVRTAAAFGGLALFLCWFVLYVRKRLGGATGDCLGFACYAGQLIVLLAASAGR
jgi:adenosylcobinamide-GDP ribazoletransferase